MICLKDPTYKNTGIDLHERGHHLYAIPRTSVP
jgi:hypothetical protein